MRTEDATPVIGVGTKTAPIRLALVNDYEIVVRGLAAMLEPFADRVEVVELEVGGSPDRRVDIALFDTFAASRDALDRARELVLAGTVTNVVLYTWDATPEFVDIAARIGVAAIVPKRVSGVDLVDLLERVQCGRQIGLDPVRPTPTRVGDELSTREREVLALLALGSSNREIAHELFLSVDTVKTYVRRLFAKLEVSNRTQAALVADRYGVGPPPGRLDRVAAAGEGGER